MIGMRMGDNDSFYLFDTEDGNEIIKRRCLANCLMMVNEIGSTVVELKNDGVTMANI
jgi:hypothetical protein